jgi:hypothetical protein
VPQHQTAAQLRTARFGCGDPGRRPPVRPQDFGCARPSKANEAAFGRAVDQVAEAARLLLASLVTNASPRDRALEASKARAKAAARFHSAGAERVE